MTTTTGTSSLAAAIARARTLAAELDADGKHAGAADLRKLCAEWEPELAGADVASVASWAADELAELDRQVTYALAEVDHVDAVTDRLHAIRARLAAGQSVAVAWAS